MRRFHALLLAAGLAAAPTGAVAGPSPADGSPPGSTTTVEHFQISTSKARLGATVIGLTPELREHFGAARDRGVLVARVAPGSPADRAGLAVGDVVVELHGRAIGSASDVLAALAETARGDTVALEVMRSRKARALRATLADDPAPRVPDASWLGEWMRELMRPFALLLPRPAHASAGAGTSA